jgi:DNA-binding NtrC family response regulator
LRFAQLREYRRLGEPFTRKCDVRLITACNTDLRALVRVGTFREDLYFRLRVVPVEIPPLAQRSDDIPVLIDHFSRKYAAEYGIDPIGLDSSALERLMSYAWPGNVRELENCIRYLMCLGLERPVGIADLPLLDETAPVEETAGESGANVVKFVDVPLREAKSMVVEGFERMYLESALRSAKGNVAQAARRDDRRPGIVEKEDVPAVITRANHGPLRHSAIAMRADDGLRGEGVHVP